MTMKDNSYSVTPDELSREFFERIDYDDNLKVSQLFGLLAHNTAAAMATSKDDNFDWIRENPHGMIAYQSAVWQFLAEITKKSTGEPHVIEEGDESTLRMWDDLAVCFSEITFGAYNKMTGGKNEMPELSDDPSYTEAIELDRRMAHFYGTYLAPQLKAFNNS